MEIKEIEKIVLNPKDVLVVTFPDDLEEEDAQASRDLMNKIFPKHTIIFKGECISIKVIKPKGE